MFNYKALLIIGALLVGLALTACGDKDGDDSGNHAVQVF